MCNLGIRVNNTFSVVTQLSSPSEGTCIRIQVTNEPVPIVGSDVHSPPGSGFVRMTGTLVAVADRSLASVTLASQKLCHKLFLAILPLVCILDPRFEQQCYA